MTSEEPTRNPLRSSARLLDATSQRLTEALRSVEDQLRFSGAPGSDRLRELRHRAGELRGSIERELEAPLMAFRDVGADPGAPGTPELTDEIEPGRHRSDPNLNGAAPTDAVDSTLARNFSRARESARSMEEALREARPRLASLAERIRYAVYEVEPAVRSRTFWRRRLGEIPLYVLLTESLASGPLADVCRRAIDGGAELVQLREKSMESGRLADIACDIAEICRTRDAIFIVNDRPDVAHIAGAHGVHQGQDDLSPALAREVIGPHGIVGVSTHGEAQARAADEAGADYIGVGPIFATQTKEHRASVGLEYIRVAQSSCRAPGFAIGAVGRRTIDEVIAAGARQVAVCTDIIGDDDPEAAAREIRSKLDAARAREESSN